MTRELSSLEMGYLDVVSGGCDTSWAAYMEIQKPNHSVKSQVFGG